MNDNNHGELECDGLHIEGQYTSRMYALSKGAVAFEAWFKDVFLPGNPSMRGAFEFSREEFKGQATMEVMAMDAYFTIDALEVMFVAWRSYKDDKAALKIVPKQTSNLN